MGEEFGGALALASGADPAALHASFDSVASSPDCGGVGEGASFTKPPLVATPARLRCRSGAGVGLGGAPGGIPPVLGGTPKRKRDPPPRPALLTARSVSGATATYDEEHSDEGWDSMGLSAPVPASVRKARRGGGLIGSAKTPMQHPRGRPQRLQHQRQQHEEHGQEQEQDQQLQQQQWQLKWQQKQQGQAAQAPQVSFAGNNFAGKEDSTFGPTPAPQRPRQKTDSNSQTPCLAAAPFRSSGGGHSKVAPATLTPKHGPEEAGLPIKTLAFTPATGGGDTSLSRDMQDFDADAEDEGSAPGTPFRFTSFPASLPRVHHRTLRSGGGGGGLPTSRTPMRAMPSDASSTSASAANTSSATPLSDASTVLAGYGTPRPRTATEDDAAWSSFAVGAGGGGPRTVLKQRLGTARKKGAALAQPDWVSPPATAAIHTKLFSDLNGSISEEGSGNAGSLHSADDRLLGGGSSSATVPPESEVAVTLGGEKVAPVIPVRTRLVFGSPLSPDSLPGEIKAGDASEESPPFPLPTFGVAATPFKGRGPNISEDGTASGGVPPRHSLGVPPPLTPNRREMGCGLRNRIDSAECSPIPPHGGSGGGAMRQGACETSPETSSSAGGASDMVLDTPPSPAMRGLIGAKKSPGRGEGHDSGVSVMSVSASSAGDSSRGDKQGGSESSGGRRKLRPMPDMSAFDVGTTLSSGGTTAAALSPHIGDIDSSATSDRDGLAPLRAPARSPFRLLCPPTPVRTPAWASHHPGDDIFGDSADSPPDPQDPDGGWLGGAGAGNAGRGGNIFGGLPYGHGHLHRSDSLVATKVLAACPPQILDGLSSLESSLLEDDDHHHHRHAHTVAADRSGDVGMLPGAAEEETSPGWSDAPVTSHGGDDEDSRGRDRDRRGLGSSGTPFARRSTFETVAMPQSPSRSLFGGGGAGGQAALAEAPTARRGSGRMRPLQEMLGVRRGFSEAGPKDDDGPGGVGSVVSFDGNFENLGLLGSGAFADVYKARCRADKQMYAIKRNRRQFRGKRDRERALAEVRTMQRLQSYCASEPDRHHAAYCVYLLFFIRAWQEDGHFFCQTELCCRDTCRQMMMSLTTRWDEARSQYPSLESNLPAPADTARGATRGRLVPESTVWKICHDIAAGLSHIHSHGMVHYDIKPSNIFFVAHARLGALCKIGDFGLAGDVGSCEDGDEGDTAYMAPELLSSGVLKHTSADVFSLGLTLYELAAADGTREPFLPAEGPRWHELRGGAHIPELPAGRSRELADLIRAMIRPKADQRPLADYVLERVPRAREAGSVSDRFLTDYVRDVTDADRARERNLDSSLLEAHRRRCTPTGPMMMRNAGRVPTGGSKDKPERSWDVRTPTPEQHPGSVRFP